MTAGQMGEFVRGLAVSLRGGGAPDAELMRDYLSRGDRAALAALVKRHAPMVWGVCRRALHHHDAEEAFQATFLVFVRRARSIASPDMLAAWLHGVARQTSMKARATAARRGTRERQVEMVPDPVGVTQLPDDALPLLDSELARLPNAQRAAVVLCDLEGLTRREAAVRLGVPEGTVASWQARGRAKLAKRLARHGLAIGGLLSQFGELVAVPPDLVPETIYAATFAAGPAAATAVVSAPVAALTEGVLNMVWLTRLKMAVASALVVAAVGVTVAVTNGTPRVSVAPVPKDGTKWQEAYSKTHSHPVDAVACSADRVAVADAGGNLYLYDAAGKEQKLIHPGGKGGKVFTRLQFTSDGKHLWAVMDGRRGMARYDLGKLDGTQPIVGSDLGVSSNGGWWLEALGTRTLIIRPNLFGEFDAARDYEGFAKFAAVVTDAVLSPDDKWVAAVTVDDRVTVYDRASLNRDHVNRPDPTCVVKQKVAAVQFSKDGKRMAVVGPHGFAALYDPATGKDITALKGHSGNVHAVAFSPDGLAVATGGADLMVRLWDAATGKELAGIKGFDEGVRSLAFDPSGERLVIGAADKTVRVWTLAK